MPAGVTHGDRGADEHDERRDQDDERGHLHLVGLDLLAEVLRRAADHQAGDEHGDDREDEHAVEPRADAAEDHLAELHQQHRHQAAERRERVVHRVDRAVRGGGRRRRPERRVGDAEADLLAFHVAARLRARSPSGRRRAPRGAGCRACSAHDAQRRAAATKMTIIAARTRPALARVADHLAEGVAERRRRSAGSTSTSRKFESGVGFSNGCAELTLKKPPPLVPSCLIATCDAAGPIGEHLLGDRLAVGVRRSPGPACAVCVGVEGLHDALRDERRARSTSESGSRM